MNPEMWWVVGPLFTFSAAMLYAILGGKLIPKATVDARIQDKEEQIKALRELAAMWEAASVKKDQAIDALVPAVTEIMADYKTTMKMIEAMGNR